MQTLTLRVPDVSCEHCVKTIDQTLTALPGLDDIHTDVDQKTVTFAFDPQQTTREQIEAALDDAGYPVQV